MSLRHPINPSDNRLARPRLRWIPVLFTFTSVLAQTPALAQAPNQCAKEPERHRFDFWIGEWNVTTKGGTPVGSSVIQSVSGGCAVLENWTSLKGGQGKSLNGYNPVSHQWQQFWIGGDGSVSEYRASELDGASLVFLMRARPDADSVSRLTFTPLDSATVRQHSEQSSDGGKSWVTQYDFYYHRRSSSR